MATNGRSDNMRKIMTQDRSKSVKHEDIKKDKEPQHLKSNMFSDPGPQQSASSSLFPSAQSQGTALLVTIVVLVILYLISK